VDELSSLGFDWLLEFVADDASDVSSLLLSDGEVVALLESLVAVLSLGALTLPLLLGLAEVALSSLLGDAGADALPVLDALESPLESLCANAPAALSAPAARKVAAILLMLIVFPPCGADGEHRAPRCPRSVTVRNKARTLKRDV
jgi:hypothetical protein